MLVPDVETAPFTFSQAIFEEAVQVRVPVPAFVIVTDWLAGAAAFWTAANESVNGLRPIAGTGVGVGGGVTDSDGGASTSARRGICAARLRMLLPPDLLVSAGLLLPPAAAMGSVPCEGGMLTEEPIADAAIEVEPVAIVAKGMAAENPLVAVFSMAESSVGWEGVTVLAAAVGTVAEGVRLVVPAGDCRTDAKGWLCGF